MSGDLLKVLFCSFDVIPEPTGTSARASDFIRGLTPLFNVDGLTVKSADHAHIERYFGMRLMRVPVGAGDLPVRAQTFERAVRRQLESDEYQLVHFTDPYGGYALCELRQQYNFKLLYEVVGFPSIEVKYTHPHLEQDKRFMSKLRRQELFCLMNADMVLVGSEQTAAMVQSLGVSPERTQVIRACADCSLYSPVGELPPPDRQPMRLLYLGNQNAWQGLSTLLFAMSISSQLADVRLAIVGPQHPTWRLQLEEMVKYRKLTGLVEFLDPAATDDLPKVLGAADVGVAPLEKSDRNTVQGAPVTKIAHYLAAGRPVIAANLPLVREIANDGCALFYEPGDENDLAEKIVALANDPARRVAMGERAALFAREKLDADLARTELLKIYASLLGSQPQPQPAPDEQTSYAPTSVGEPAEPESRDGATLTYESAPRQDPTTDPFRRLIAQTAAHLDDAPPAAGEPLSSAAGRLDGPPTPRGLEALAGEEPAPAAQPLGDAVDPLEYDFNATQPLPIPPPSFAALAGVEPPPGEPQLSPRANDGQLQLGFGVAAASPASGAPAGWRGDDDLELKLDVDESPPPAEMFASAPAAPEAAPAGEVEAPLFEPESETIRFDAVPDEPVADFESAVTAAAQAPPEPPVEDLSAEVSLEEEHAPPAPEAAFAPAATAEVAPEISVEEAEPVHESAVEEVQEVSEVQEVVEITEEPAGPPAAALAAEESSPIEEISADVAIEEVLDGPTPEPVAEGDDIALEPEEATTIVPEPAPPPRSLEVVDAIEVVDADLESPTMAMPGPMHASSPWRGSDVPWDVEPEGEADRLAAIKKAAAEAGPYEPLPAAASEPTTEETAVEVEVAEASPEEVFEVEEITPDEATSYVPEATLPASAAPAPAAQAAQTREERPSSIVADILNPDKALSARANAITLRLPATGKPAVSAPATPPPAPVPSAPKPAPQAAPPAAAAPKSAAPPPKPAPAPPAPAAKAPAQPPPAPAVKPAAAPPQPAARPVAPLSPTLPPAAKVAPPSPTLPPTAKAPPPPGAPAARPTPPPAQPVAARPAAPAAKAPPPAPVVAARAEAPTQPPPPARAPVPAPQPPAARAPLPAAVAPPKPGAQAPVQRPVTPVPPPPAQIQLPAAVRVGAAPVVGPPTAPRPAVVTARPAAPGAPPRPAAQAGPPVLYPAGKAPAPKPPGAPIAPGAPRPAPILAATGARASGIHRAVAPGPAAPVELDAAEVVQVATSDMIHTPPSGLQPPDEWLGHVLLGYAPFDITISRTWMIGETPLIDPAKGGATPRR